MGAAPTPDERRSGALKPHEEKNRIDPHSCVHVLPVMQPDGRRSEQVHLPARGYTRVSRPSGNSEQAPEKPVPRCRSIR